MPGPQDDRLDAYLDAVLVWGREQRAIEIVEHSTECGRRYEAERRRITRALGPTARRIEHIGSTAVRAWRRSR